MANSRFRLDRRGVRAVLHSAEVTAEINRLAHDVATAVEAQVDAEDGVDVDEYSTDRSAASVAIRDPAGLIWQARDGVLTKAAAARGLEVRAE